MQDFLQLQSEAALIRLEKLLRLEKMHESNIEPMSMNEFNQRIDQSIKDYESGNVLTSLELQEEMEKWGTK